MAGAASAPCSEIGHPTSVDGSGSSANLLTGHHVISGTGKYAGATGTGSFDGVPTKWKDASLFDGKFKITTDATKAQ